MSLTLPPVRSATRPTRLVRLGAAAPRALTLATLAALAAACSDVASVPRAADTAAEISNLPPGLTAADVRAHVIAPRHIEGARLEENDPTREVLFRAPWLDRQGAAAAISADVAPTTSADVATVNLGEIGRAHV